MTITWQTLETWLKPVLKSKLPTKLPCPQAEDFQTDSRQLCPGQWFIPLFGDNFDGHNFIKQALEQKAKGFLYSQKDLVSEKDCAIQVTDTLKAYQLIASGWLKQQNQLKKIALTGSVGKTSTKDILHSILSNLFPTVATEKNYNNEIGVSKTLLSLKSQAQFLIVEMGARKRGDIKELSQMVEADVCLCLNAKSSHLEIFGSHKNLLAAKTEIFTHSPQKSTLVVNRDQEDLFAKASLLNKKLISFGYHHEADLKIKEVKWLKTQKMLLSFFWKNKDLFEIKTPYAHDSLPLNLAAALATLLAAGLNKKQIPKNLDNSLASSPGRFYTLQNKKGTTLIDDSYNASPASMKSGLLSLNKIYPDRPLILVLGDMLELGAESVKEHQQIGSLCAKEIKPHILLTVGEKAQQIALAAQNEGLAADKITSFKSVNDILAAKFDFLKEGFVVYLKASHGVNLKKLAENLQKVF